MGGYSDKLSYEERWNVIHYIRSCQASSKELQYNEKWNTFKPTAAISDSLYQVMNSKKAVPTMTKKMAEPASTEHTTTEPPHTEGGHEGH